MFFLFGRFPIRRDQGDSLLRWGVNASTFQEARIQILAFFVYLGIFEVGR